MRLPVEIEGRMDALRSQVEQGGVELLEVQFRRNGSRGFLTLIVDRPGGVSLDDCAEVNRRVGAYLDAESERTAEAGSFLSGSYLLEVQSPGLDRPLKQPKDFERALNERVRIAWRTPQGAGLVAQGILRRCDTSGVVVADKAGAETRIEYDQITKAAKDV